MRRLHSAWLRCAVALAALAAVYACSGSLLGPDTPQGIEGLVLVGPMCPVQSQDDPCPDQPYQAWIDIRSVAGGSVTRVQSGEDGLFRVGLSPGRYALVPESGFPFPAAGPLEVDVAPKVYSQVTVNYDSGIR